TSELVRTGGRRRQHAKPHGLAGRAAQRVVTRNRLLMRTLSAVYESAPSQIPVRQRFSCAGYSDRDRCSKRPVSTYRQCPKHSWNAYTQGGRAWQLCLPRSCKRWSQTCWPTTELPRARRPRASTKKTADRDYTVSIKPGARRTHLH